MKNTMAKKFLCVVTLIFGLLFGLFSCINNDNAKIINESTHTHTYKEWNVRKISSCEVKGEEYRACDCGAEETRSIPENKVHSELKKKIENTNFETPYVELYKIYQSLIDHKKEFNCNLTINDWLGNMLYGKWVNSDDFYITYTYLYSDYNNTVGSAWYATNLTTSMVSGNTYVYYMNVKDDKVVIAYADKLTKEKIDNFIISFNENAISVKNMNDGKTYNLIADVKYDKIQKGNSKMAYVYIAKKIFSFKYPSSVEVTQCYVDYEEKTVYATIQATNVFGGTINTDYKLYENNGQYFITEFTQNYATNIDLSELNQKLQNHVSSGG